MSTPGLNGDYSWTCTVCSTATDTALALRGEPEWIMGFLHHLGSPMDQSMQMVATFYNDHNEELLGRLTVPFLVCGECTQNANLPDPGLAIAGSGAPLIEQPSTT